MRATNAEGTGDWSPSGQATAAANQAPAFGATSYTFELTENDDGSTTAIDVGTVSADDADTGHTVSYTILVGNTGSVFAIGTSSGPSSGSIAYTGSGEDFESFADPGQRVHADGAGERRPWRQRRRHRDRRRHRRERAAGLHLGDHGVLRGREHRGGGHAGGGRPGCRRHHRDLHARRHGREPVQHLRRGRHQPSILRPTSRAPQVRGGGATRTSTPSPSPRAPAARAARCRRPCGR